MTKQRLLKSPFNLLVCSEDNDLHGFRACELTFPASSMSSRQNHLNAAASSIFVYNVLSILSLLASRNASRKSRAG